MAKIELPTRLFPSLSEGEREQVSNMFKNSVFKHLEDAGETKEKGAEIWTNLTTKHVYDVLMALQPPLPVASFSKNKKLMWGFEMTKEGFEQIISVLDHWSAAHQ